MDHKIGTLDVQPSANDAIVCFVSGQLSIDGGNPLMYSESFVLMKGGQFGYYVHNDIFRLNLA